MLISALAAITLLAAPEAVSGEATKAAAEAKPATRKVCTTIEVAGSRMPKKKCREEPVKAATKPGEGGEPASKGQTKPE
jgi:hypothetical protein